ncbi:glycosyltransferase family 2 protein [Herbiconiux sp. CPCC 205716]|uniref:Glycosyltransferase family 2 protein n=1 Tax=Herbiconiux gentiana TaxID=2970912 RepID=A0ABT2GBY7_9MICO|nr:glycosyltransferase family A protein [Herbiconiux gentiana]MCS5713726.1 glycosyltransferase family 2 protein [Herbiconiux gentiana]
MSSISCIIPTHRRSDLLAEALRSVASQTRPPLEIIVVSDTDDPGAAEVCERFRADSAIPIQFHSSAGTVGGASDSRNRGFRESIGEYVAFLDDDDTWEPRFLEECEQALAASNRDIAVAWITMFREAATKTGPAIVEGLSASDVVAVNAGTTGSNMVISRTALDDVGGFDPSLRMKNDTDLFYRLLKAGNGYSVVPERLVNQRKHDTGQLTGHSLARAAATERYMAKHAADLNRSDRRQLRFVIHRIRRHASTNRLAKAYHLVMTILHYSLAQYRIDRANRSEKDYFTVPAIEDSGGEATGT